MVCFMRVAHTASSLWPHQRRTRARVHVRVMEKHIEWMHWISIDILCLAGIESVYISLLFTKATEHVTSNNSLKWFILWKRKWKQRYIISLVADCLCRLYALWPESVGFIFSAHFYRPKDCRNRAAALFSNSDGISKWNVSYATETRHRVK